jgi:1,4-alpha-glucan branching enzyme
VDDGCKLLAYRKSGLVFLFNFHPTQSFESYELPLPHGTPIGSRWQVAFDSDSALFGGQGRISGEVAYDAVALTGKSGNVGVRIYTPARTAMALRRLD